MWITLADGKLLASFRTVFFTVVDSCFFLVVRGARQALVYDKKNLFHSRATTSVIPHPFLSFSVVNFLSIPYQFDPTNVIRRSSYINFQFTE